MAISLKTRLVRNTDVHQASIGADQFALLNLNGGEYYGVEGSAAHIWVLLENEISVEAICDRLAAEFDLERNACEADTVAFLADLVAEKLVKIVN